jgi:hypothetical protein
MKENNKDVVINEITILNNLEHKGIVRLIDYGDNGYCVKPSGRKISNIVYIIMEFI